MLLRLLLIALRNRFRSRERLEVEILVLRHQLNVLRRRYPRRVKRLTGLDRGLFVWLLRRCPEVASAITIVRPETVLRWHRKGFRTWWCWKARGLGGRPRARNPRTHTARQIQQIAASIKEFGFISPILIDGADEIIAGHGRAEADEVPAIDRAVLAVSHPGDRWRIGNHFLLCGDALKRDSYVKLLGAQKAQMVFTDPPYNVPIAGNVSGLGRVKHREFAMASGEMNAHEFATFLATAFKRLADFSINGSIHFVCMDWRHIHELLEAAAKPYSELKNLCVWSKTNAGMGSLYRSQFELIFVLKRGTAPHVNNVELGRFGRNRTNVWNYPGMNTFGKDRGDELAMHPTVKPLALVADAILDCSKRGGIILDAFAGSGTTLIAAERTGRRGYGIEIDPHYADTIIRRFDEVYGLKAIHADSKLDFEGLRKERSKEKHHG
jgi:DNA modification methylase